MANSTDALNNPIWQALTTHQATLAIGDDLARIYQPEVARFGGIAAPTPEAFNSLAKVVAPGGTVALLSAQPITQTGWSPIRHLPLVQMVYEGPALEAVENADPLTPLLPSQVPAMLALVELTHPGPYFARTIEMGHYLGIWQGERLAAMAGERFHLPGFCEISAVCTHPDFQRRGYAKQLMLQLIHDLQQRGEVPFLHVVRENTGAQTLYKALGFTQRAEFFMNLLRHQPETSES
jgi:ribosomal protein S18 acetylase RimI-like enzyme